MLPHLTIDDVHKPSLLRALWESAAVSPLFKASTGPHFNMFGVEKAVAHKIDYYSGRQIALDLSVGTLLITDCKKYEENSSKTVAQVVADVRASMAQHKCASCGSPSVAFYKQHFFCSSCHVMLLLDHTLHGSLFAQ